ncbi:M56 family metallopeptidase [Paenibacillaceae bacterium WGS1546]|uniref:M56 family metallopeptidase n=1 Tax=Cohnella sp. WGS1546 TaxID=3366810 RepID=UPI00372CF200
MNTILELLFPLTVAGSIVVVCLLLLRLVPVHVFPTTWRYGMSKMAVGFYLLPVALGIQWISPLFALNEWPSTIQHALPGQYSGFNLEPFITERTIPANIVLSFIRFWAIGAIAFAAWQTYCYRRFLKKLEHTRTSVPKNSEAAIQLSSIKETLGVKSNVQLAYSSAIRSPVLVGLWKPTIYLPMENAVNVDMGMVIRHEMIHLKRKDLWVKAFTLSASALHWFNPLVHILRKDIHIWSELSCDEEVVKEMSHAERKCYGETILNVMAGSRNLPVQFCASLSSDGKQLKRRLTIMLNVKKMKKRTLVMTIAALISVGAIGTTTAVWASSNTPKIESEAPETLSELEYFIGNGENGLKEVEETPAVQKSSHERIEFVGPSDSDSIPLERTTLHSVKLSDESKFTPEEWQDILLQIERGEVILEDE